MRIYPNLYDAVKETERELIEMGTEVYVESMQDKVADESGGFFTKELQGYGYIITNQISRDEDFIKLGGKLEYVQAEFIERITTSWINPGNSWKWRKEIWEPFLHEGRFSYTYNERLREQLSQILEELKLRPNTRQAIITIYDRHQDLSHLGGKARIPCSMYYQFLRRKRNGQEILDCIYTMRSCDIYTHYIYDIWLTMKIQEFIANSLGIEPGHFTHFIGSLHVYKKDYLDKGIF